MICCTSASESERRLNIINGYWSAMLLTFAFPAPWTTVKIKPHQPAITNDKISDKQAASSSLHCVCFVAFVWGFHHTAIQRANLSGRCRLNPTVQTRFPPYSSKIRTWAASLLKPSGCSRKSVIVLLLYHKRTPTLGGTQWTEPLKPLCWHWGAICCR